MRRVTLLEYDRLRRAHSDGNWPDGSGDNALSPALFDRLYRYDVSRPEPERIFTWHRDYAKASQWVGVIQLPGLLLEVLPKIDGHPSAPDTARPGEAKHFSQSDASAATRLDEKPGQDSNSDHQGPVRRYTRARDNLLYMLAVAGSVPLRAQDIAQLAHRRAALSETLAALFARRLRAELLRGPARGYLTVEENLRTIRGKLQLGPHLKHNAGHQERFYCQHDHFSEDIPLNRLLRAVCRVLLGLTELATIQEALRHCLLMLDDVPDVPDPRALLEQITLDRQQARFADLFSFARLILEHHAPLPGAGGTRCFSLMFDMNVIFERFIAGLLRTRVLPVLQGVRLHLQGRQRRRHLLVEDGGRPELVLKPDFLLQRDDGPPLIMDTKWKRLSARARRSGVGEGDLYQLYAYTMRFEAARSVLLYPAVPGVKRNDYRLLHESGSAPTRHLRIRFVDLHGQLWCKAEQERLRAELTALVREGLDGL